MTPPSPKPPANWSDTSGIEVIPPRTSGAAIASCVLGVAALLMGWFPGCGSIPGLLLAIVALVLALVARRTARTMVDANRTLPVIDLFLAILALLVSLIATGVLVNDIIQARQNDPTNPEHPSAVTRQQFEEQPADVPDGESVWRAVNAVGQATYGFLIQPATTPAAVVPVPGTYAATPTAGFIEDLPTHLVDPAAEVSVAARISFGMMTWFSPHTRIFPVTADAGPAPFTYAGPLPTKPGDRITVITPSETIGGAITLNGTDNSAMMISLDRPMTAPVPPAQPAPHAPATQSVTPAADLAVGCPVVLDATGTVIGILIGGEMGDPTILYADMLLWPIDTPEGSVSPSQPPSAGE